MTYNTRENIHLNAFYRGINGCNFKGIDTQKLIELQQLGNTYIGRQLEVSATSKG